MAKSAATKNAPAEKVGAAVEEYAGLVLVGVTLTGDSPMLVNAMSGESLLNIRNKVKTPKAAAKPSLEEESRGKLHLLGDGRPCLPVRNLYAAFINAGKFVRLDGKRMVTTAQATVLPGMMQITSTEMLIYSPHTDDPAPWRVDIQQGRNPNGGEAVCIVRPCFDAWEVRLTLEIDQAEMPVRMARDLVDIAGRRVGVCDNRPQRKGSYGRFKVTRWEPVAPTARHKAA
jgi:hypothetical protein